MNNTFSKVLVFIVLSAMALFLGLQSREESAAPSEGDSPLPDILADEPDVLMENATITQHTPSGALKYKLFSKQLRYFEQENLTRLVALEMTLYPDHKQLADDSVKTASAPWTVESKYGYVRQRTELSAQATQKHRLDSTPGPDLDDKELIFLREDVKLSHHSADKRSLVLRTETLYVYPHRQFAETDQPVMIDSTVGRTKSVGFTGNLETGLLNLFSNEEQRVHTIVLPEQIRANAASKPGT